MIKGAANIPTTTGQLRQLKSFVAHVTDYNSCIIYMIKVNVQVLRNFMRLEYMRCRICTLSLVAPSVSVVESEKNKQ